MLIWLFEYLEPFWQPFQVVHYITFRTLMAALTSLAIALSLVRVSSRSCKATKSVNKFEQMARLRIM